MSQLPLRRGEEHAFFSPMGAGVGAVFTPPASTAALAQQQQQQQRGPSSAMGAGAGTPSKLAAQEMYWRWFQMADTGAPLLLLWD